MDQASRITSDTIVCRHPEQIAAEIDGEVIVMSLSQGKYVGLDDIASLIWRRLEGAQRVSDLCQGLGREFSGDPDTIRGDVVDLLNDLQDLCLVQIVSVGAPAEPPPAGI